jgi:hypothetical protein
LAARSDLDPKLNRELRSSLGRTMQPPPPGAFGTVSGIPVEMTSQAALPYAIALRDSGRLDEPAILDALRCNATGAATAMLAVKADVPLHVIERACALRSAKAMVSLAWKAGLSMPTTVVLQSMLTGLSPELVLRPDDGGGFPLPIEELRWQLAFLGIAGQGPKPWTPRRMSSA